MGDQVTLVLTASGSVSSVWGSRDAADALVAKLNADPFVAAGEPDPDAPYSAQTWGVS